MRKPFKDRFFLLSRIAAAGAMLFAGSMAWSGTIEAKLFDPGDGTVHDVRTFKNAVVDAGRAATAARLVASAVGPITHMACGSSATAVAAGQTTLVTEVARVAASTATSAAAVATIIATFPAGTATGTVNEIGLFNASSNGTMYARALTGAIGKPANLSLQFTWTITLS